MTEKRLPDWDNDPLSVFFRDTEQNVRVTALKFPKVYELLGQVHSLFQKSEEATKNDRWSELVVTRFLMVRSHSSFLAGIRLVMSGQVPESFPVLRSVVESAWYALHIAKDPRGTKRYEIWQLRDETKAGASTPATLAYGRTLATQMGTLNEGRSVNPGDTNLTGVVDGPPRSLNEGRSVNPGDTLNRLRHNELQGSAQRRPERQPRRHPEPSPAQRVAGLRSTKAGASTPATP